MAVRSEKNAQEKVKVVRLQKDGDPFS